MSPLWMGLWPLCTTCTARAPRTLQFLVLDVSFGNLALNTTTTTFPSTSAQESNTTQRNSSANTNQRLASFPPQNSLRFILSALTLPSTSTREPQCQRRMLLRNSIGHGHRSRRTVTTIDPRLCLSTKLCEAFADACALEVDHVCYETASRCWPLLKDASDDVSTLRDNSN
jgi:hypothetical protein